MEWQDQTYICFNCKLKFLKGWSDQAALKEKEKEFPSISWKEMYIVCDDCFKTIMKFNKHTGF